ncbi:MAG: RNA-binding protein [Thermoplasmata archaeon HGW-Thermoplasmata-1]|nr:MAG: RNA-binding protein [Thermoplasmata archaeon HGW-Thermoplasmata-1]
MKSKATKMEATLQIGKGGISEGVVEELRVQLKDRKLVKVKLLRSALEEGGRREMAEKLAEMTNATLIDVRGSSVVLYKR